MTLLTAVMAARPRHHVQEVDGEVLVPGVAPSQPSPQTEAAPSAEIPSEGRVLLCCKVHVKSHLHLHDPHDVMEVPLTSETPAGLEREAFLGFQYVGGEGSRRRHHSKRRHGDEKEKKSKRDRSDRESEPESSHQTAAGTPLLCNKQRAVNNFFACKMAATCLMMLESDC